MTTFKLNDDILYLIFKPFQDNKTTLYSCLLVNKNWCKIIIPILWGNPWKGLKVEKKKSLLNVIISHLSEDSKNNLDQKIQRPLFNYITFCKHLNFDEIVNIIDRLYDISKIPIIKNEIVNLFINENTKFTHLYLPRQFDYQLHIIPGAKNCFSELGFISCNTNINDDVLDGLIEICEPIKELELFIDKDYNYRFVKLIKAIKRLSNFRLLGENYSVKNDEFCEIIENSLIQHGETIQCFKTTVHSAMKVFSSFVNLKRLELDNSIGITMTLENVSLPFLQILKAKKVSIKDLTNLIENTSGYLTVIKINRGDYNEVNNKRIIQVIYQNCPKLKCLKLEIMNDNILELNQLSINCQYLNELYILDYYYGWVNFDWNNTFEILTKSSPINLFKFGFSKFSLPDLESLKLFFDNWKGRHPMILKSDWYDDANDYIELIEKYKAKGIVKKIFKKSRWWNF
ncbi:hypothetical protein C1645_838419 [Glomus cerebriforme]|uniref:F-box domain-containing protein n=1 Tax=Glomus cerebriforme TaxID=658196 RepID=A0A397S9D1_9GLOM|nr:hypothetical protein C1645_838419 [Glomus cerebriforme]